LAAELVGVGRAALALGIEHVTARTQFGRPIGSFQAVRHRLAEVHADLAGAATLVEVAFLDDDAASAMIAKAAAGRAADKAVRSVMQVSGAIGLTAEYDLHRHVRRAAVLDQLAGDSPRLEQRLGQMLLERSA
jgi:alkylation response protein AidB-like acyl-CoA dehydrogenase